MGENAARDPKGGRPRIVAPADASQAGEERPMTRDESVEEPSEREQRRHLSHEPLHPTEAPIPPEPKDGIRPAKHLSIGVDQLHGVLEALRRNLGIFVRCLLERIEPDAGSSLGMPT